MKALLGALLLVFASTGCGDNDYSVCDEGDIACLDGVDEFDGERPDVGPSDFRTGNPGAVVDDVRDVGTYERVGFDRTATPETFQGRERLPVERDINTDEELSDDLMQDQDVPTFDGQRDDSNDDPINPSQIWQDDTQVWERHDSVGHQIQ